MRCERDPNCPPALKSFLVKVLEESRIFYSKNICKKKRTLYSRDREAPAAGANTPPGEDLEAAAAASPIGSHLKNRKKEWKNNVSKRTP